MQTSLWTTASPTFGADSLRLDSSALGAHFKRCNGARGPWHAVQCLGDLAHAFIAPRFVTTVGIAAIGVALLSKLV